MTKAQLIIEAQSLCDLLQTAERAALESEDFERYIRVMHLRFAALFRVQRRRDARQRRLFNTDVKRNLMLWRHKKSLIQNGYHANVGL